MKERLELAFAYSSRSSSSLKHCYLSQCTWTGFEDQCLFDVAFCHEMGFKLRETSLLTLTGL